MSGFSLFAGHSFSPERDMRTLVVTIPRKPGIIFPSFRHEFDSRHPLSYAEKTYVDSLYSVIRRFFGLFGALTDGTQTTDRNEA